MRLRVVHRRVLIQVPTPPEYIRTHTSVPGVRTTQGKRERKTTLTRTLFEARDLSLTLSTFVVCVREPADRTALPNSLVQPNGILCRMKDSPHRCSFPLDSIRATMWLVRHYPWRQATWSAPGFAPPEFFPPLTNFQVNLTFLVLTFSSKTTQHPPPVYIHISFQVHIFNFHHLAPRTS